MSQRSRVAKAHRLAVEIIKQIIEEKASRLEAKGYTTISSKEIYKYCVERVEEEDKCIGITTYVARLLNRYATRLNSYRARWRITTDLLKRLFKVDESYGEVKDTPLNNLNDIHFLYIVTTLLYEAKPEGGADGDGN
jgi:hypothetical protein